MNQSALFSWGLELANVLVASDLLTSSWDAISELSREKGQPSSSFSVKLKAYKRPKCTIIAFVPSSACTKNQLLAEADLAPVSTLKDICPHFDFLSTKSSPSFSIHKGAATLFASLHAELTDLKAKILTEKPKTKGKILAEDYAPLIITGHSLGGSIASLFALWLLEDINLSASTRPICITFGSPLVGDKGFQHTLWDHSAWNSCFLHVASSQDPVPRLFASIQSGLYKPFGTYLMCSESGASSFDEADSILQLVADMDLESRLSNTRLHSGGRLPDVNYGKLMEYLKNQVIYSGICEFGQRITEPLRAGLGLQLETTGFKKSQQEQLYNTCVAALAKNAEDVAKQKARAMDPVKNLNESKISMANLEWYKTDSKAAGVGYYDAYKNLLYKQDQEMTKYKRRLTKYWDEEVKKAENRPHKEGSFFRTGWLGAGTNYRRMVEPLHIADYYRKPGAKDYINKGRASHYVLLEKWEREDKTRAGVRSAASNQRMASSLTEDSCFWSHVEEAIISCNLLSNGGTSPTDQEPLKSGLLKFEDFVMELIMNYAVSPEIFLEQSSFMIWWREYEKIIENDHNHPLTVYMKDRKYEQYA